MNAKRSQTGKGRKKNPTNRGSCARHSTVQPTHPSLIAFWFQGEIIIAHRQHYCDRGTGVSFLSFFPNPSQLADILLGFLWSREASEETIGIPVIVLVYVPTRRWTVNQTAVDAEQVCCSCFFCQMSPSVWFPAIATFFIVAALKFDSLCKTHDCEAAITAVWCASLCL